MDSNFWRGVGVFVRSFVGGEQFLSIEWEETLWSSPWSSSRYYVEIFVVFGVFPPFLGSLAISFSPPMFPFLFRAPISFHFAPYGCLSLYGLCSLLQKLPGGLVHRVAPCPACGPFSSLFVAWAASPEAFTPSRSLPHPVAPPHGLGGPRDPPSLAAACPLFLFTPVTWAA
eukprot:Gb_32400 [translate_table: standard]